MPTRPTAPKSGNPFEFWASGVQLAMLAAETQTVVGLRLLGMSGMWAVAPTENARMIAEKGPAFAASATAAMRAAARGESADGIMSAAIRPLRRKTKSNARRLTLRGPRFPG